MITIDARSSSPIYEQIVQGMKENILKGILLPGDKLPSVRELASMIMTNPNTVSKAYGELERQKVIETIRGKGTFVSQSYRPRIEEDRMNKLKEDLKKIILEAYYMGVDKEKIVEIMDEFYTELNVDKGKNVNAELQGNKEV
ncbi:transcriptional regulator, GntR family [Clostridium amylolyticum]|uniref:Transcriptional regulator, GntR family n=1 Tax=Clostridium amylolyticum TaxID=1121298 RepID=A0A1M6LFI8_9CLOT|nr:GntR family transcriptional regulator [Clostridium amylolyticum]SHJ69916.1 transcriptional regulator, GntR family [Clostridium amylolyticum]